MNITAKIVSGSLADTDYTIAYIDGEPVAIVEESDGGYYGNVGEKEYVHNQYEQRYWYVERGTWHHAFAGGSPLIDIMDGFTPRDINDGSQEVYDGDLESLT